MLDRIQIDACVCEGEGRATIRRVRITVDFVLKLRGDGQAVKDTVRDYDLEDVYQAPWRPPEVPHLWPPQTPPPELSRRG